MTPELYHSVLRGYTAEDAGRVTLPAEAYHDEQVFDAETESIFMRSWIVAGRSSQLSVGEYLAVTIAGEPVIVVRDRAGTLRAMSAVCRHRFMPLVESGRGKVRMFECPYHRWTYDLDGCLKGAPFMRGNEDFRTSDVALPQFQVEEWLGFAFVNLAADAPELSPQLSEPADRLRRHQLEDAEQVYLYEGTWEANWKIVMENVSEAYHHFGLHPDTVDPTAPTRLAGVDVESDGPWVMFQTPMAQAAAPPSVLDLSPDDLQAIQFVNVLPCLNAFTVGEVTIWARYLPVTATSTRVTTGVLLPPAVAQTPEGEVLAKSLGEFIDTINGEDQKGVEAVQRGVRSRYATRGHLSPMEGAVLAFYRYLAQMCTATGASADQDT